MSIRILRTLFLTAAALTPHPARAQEDVPPNEVAIEAISYNGTGCKPGSVSYNLSPDRKAFTAMYSDYLIDTSTRQGRPMRKTCDVNLQLRIPDGWTFTVFGVDVRGYAAIQAGAVGVQKIHAKFGQPQQIAQLRLTGPFDDNFINHAETNLQTVEWSKCGTGRSQKVTIKTALSIHANGASDEAGDSDQGHGSFPVGYMTIDSLDGALTHKYNVAWKRCPGNPGHGGGNPGNPGHGGGNPGHGGGNPGHGGGNPGHGH